MNLSTAHVLITGGGRGIGRHLVEQFTRDAQRVCVFEKDQSAIAELGSTFASVSAYQCDVTDAAAVSKSLVQLEADGFKLDVLVNNAGLIYSAPLINLLKKTDRVHSAEKWREVLETNLSSVFYVTGAVIDHMLRHRKKGVIVSMSSISARGNSGQSAYSAAKAGVNALTRTWAKELSCFGLRFVSIAPGFINSPSTYASLNEALLTKLKHQIPLRRLGEIADVYQSIRFVVENEYVNGTVIEIDGGLTI